MKGDSTGGGGARGLSVTLFFIQMSLKVIPQEEELEDSVLTLFFYTDVSPFVAAAAATTLKHCTFLLFYMAVNVLQFIFIVKTVLCFSVRYSVCVLYRRLCSITAATLYLLVILYGC